MAKYTEAEIIQILRDADIPEKDIPLMIAIAMAESRGDSDAVGDVKLANDKWDASIGLFQVRSLRNPEKYSKADKLRIKDKLFDPVYNAKVAYEISKKGKDWSPWSTYNDDSYKEFLPSRSSRSQIRIAGGGRGKGKPITMAASGSTPSMGSDKDLKELQKNLRDAQSTLKDYESKIKRANKEGVTAKSITDQKQLIDDIKTKIDTRKKELTPGRETVQQLKEKTAQRAEEIAIQRSADAVSRYEELKAASEAGEKVSVGVAGGRPVLKYVTDDMLKKAKERATQVEPSIALETPTPQTSEFVNPNLTTNFDGSPKPIVPRGMGESVYLGDVESFKEVPLPSLGAKTETRTMAVSGGTNVPQDLETLKRMWFNTDPKAQALVQRFKNLYASKGKVATQRDWESALNDTAAVNMDNPTQTLWVTAENQINGGGGGTGTGPSAKELKNKRDAVRLLATELGVELTDGQVNSLGYDYANGNIDATTVKSRIASTGNINFATGEAAKTIDSLKATAASYGVSYDPSWYNQSAKDILTGKVDNDTIAQQLKELAKSRYPSLAKQIDAGYTVKQVASPYLQSMANILEINPNDITMEDPTIKQAFTSLNADGQPSTKALWQFEQDLKQDPRWRFTKNAQTDLMGTARKVLQDFGLVY
jgi:sugar-specific transcriptional regulator TrmB